MTRKLALLAAALLIGLPSLSHAQTAGGTPSTNQPGASENAPGQKKARGTSAKTYAPGQQTNQPSTGADTTSGTATRR